MGRYVLILVVLVAGLIFALPVLTMDEREPIVVRPKMILREPPPPPPGRPPLESLGQTLRLEFKVIMDGKEDTLAEILCATSGYRMALHRVHDEIEENFNIEGYIKLIRDDELLLTYELEMRREAEEEVSEIGAGGSVLLRDGEEKAVINMAEKLSFVIKVSFLKEERKESL